MRHSLSRKVSQFIIPLVLLFSTYSHANPPAAEWMSGEWGIGFRFRADDKQDINRWDADILANQISEIPGVRYVLFNLSDAAHGDAYIAPHSVLSLINPRSTPTSPDDDPLNGRDLFLEMANAFHAKGIKVIAYCATQGPAMLKHGAAKAYDSVLEEDGTYSSVAMANWETYVTQEYGAATDETYKQAYAEVIIDEYAERYGTLIDGWWFDHSGFANIPLLHQVVKSHNASTVVAFNDGQKIPLTNNHPGFEDYTFGHPTPIAQKNSNDEVNLPMLTSIEATAEGYFEDGEEVSLGHMFIPIQETWNSGELVWTAEQGAEWMGRCLAAGGAWTWNVDVNDEASTLRADVVDLLESILAEFVTSNGTPYSWLDSHHLVSNGDYEAADLIDFDGDGQPNHLEYVAGTDPTDRNDVLAITSFGVSDGNFTIEWTSRPDRVYTLQQLEDPANLGWSVLAANISGVDISTSYSAPLLESSLLLRVTTDLPE